MTTRLHAAGVGLLAAACMVACGGDDSQDAPDPNGPTTFRAYVQSGQALAPAATGAPASGPLTAADVAEIGQRSRDWAVSVLAAQDSDLDANALTIPPLHFALTHAVASAARGETLAALRAHQAQPSNVNVEAGLMQGVARRVSAAPDAVFSGEFMNAISMTGRPGTWQPLELHALSATAAPDPKLRLSIHDQIIRDWAWAQVQAFSGTFAGRGGMLKVPMLRVSGPVLRHHASSYSAVGMPLPDSTWLIQITPDAALADWQAASLTEALADVAVAIAARPASAAATGDMVLPVGTGGETLGMEDRPGLALATDPVNANMKGLDGLGGTFLNAPPGQAYLDITANGLRYGGTQLAQFIFSVSNLHSSGVVVTNVTLPPFFPPPCPSRAVELRPSYLAVMHANGSIALLARLAWPAGEVCVQQ